MAWAPIPTPDRKDDDGITVDDAPIVIDDIEIIDEPRIIEDHDDIEVEDEIDIGQSPTLPGPTTTEIEVEEAAGVGALFGPEMTAGISVAILFVIFVIVLTSGAPEQPRDIDDAPVAQTVEQEPPAVAPEVIEVEIGEPLVLERGE